MWAAHEKIERPFPLPFVMFFIGYLLILAIDRAAAQKFHMKYNSNQVADDGKMLTSEAIVNASTNNAKNIEMQEGTDRNALNLGETAPVPPPAKPTEKQPQTSVHVSKTAAIILVLAIGVHAFFEGIAFGL